MLIITVNKQAAYISEEDYLEGEKISEVKHEYVDGNVYAMAGASKNHENISGNIFRKFGNHLEDSSCVTYHTDVKVRTPAGNYRYPDCMVVCDEDNEEEYFSESPVILVEVISRSSRKTDEQTKRLEYINIPSLKEFVLIEQDYVDVAVFRKSEGWQPTHYFLGEDVVFESIELSLPVETIYHRVVNQDMTEFLQAKAAKLK